MLTIKGQSDLCCEARAPRGYEQARTLRGFGVATFGFRGAAAEAARLRLDVDGLLQAVGLEAGVEEFLDLGAAGEVGLFLGALADLMWLP